MAKQDNSLNYEPKQIKRGYGITDIRTYIPSKETKENVIGRVLWIIFVIILIVIGTYSYFWLTSSKGKRSLVNAKTWVSTNLNPVRWFERLVGSAKSAGNVWNAEYNATETGLIFKNLKVVGPSEILQGNSISFAYDLKLVNTKVEDMPIYASCKVKDKDINGEIKPNQPPIHVSGDKIKTAVRCYIKPEDTRDLEGTEQVVGKISFPYQTDNVKLKVYFITEDLEEQLNGQDFFDYYNIDENLPIRANYNGEPVQIGIGVNPDNVQPVIVGPNSNPYIGISLKNMWDGKVKDINQLKIVLPKGLDIDETKSDNPNSVCPFMKSRETNDQTEFVAVNDLLKDIVIKENNFITFECWLKGEPDILSSAVHVPKYYQASVKYTYELPERFATFTVKTLHNEEEDALVV